MIKQVIAKAGAHREYPVAKVGLAFDMVKHSGSRVQSIHAADDIFDVLGVPPDFSHIRDIPTSSPQLWFFHIFPRFAGVGLQVLSPALRGAWVQGLCASFQGRCAQAAPTHPEVREDATFRPHAPDHPCPNPDTLHRAGESTQKTSGSGVSRQRRKRKFS